MSILVRNNKWRRYYKYYCSVVASICLAFFSPTSSAFAITGNVDAPYSPWVLKLLSAYPNNYHSSCTGIQISSQWVLASLHCYEGTPGGINGLTAIRSENLGSNIPESAAMHFDIVEPLHGDLVALRLTERDDRYPFAPLNIFRSPETMMGAYVNTYGYGTPGNNRLGSASGINFNIHPDPDYPSGRSVSVARDFSTGGMEAGDSGGPVLSDGFVVGLHSGIDRRYQEQTIRYWTPLFDSTRYISQYLQPTLADTFGETNHLIMTAWQAVDCLDIPAARQRRDVEPDKNTNTCPNITGFKLFYKKTSENPSWKGAQSVYVTRDEISDLQKIKKTEITIDQSEQKNQLWSITVLPVDNTGRVLGADVNNIPRDGDDSNAFITTTTDVSMPQQLEVHPRQDPDDFIRVSWRGSYSKIADKIKGYALFYKHSDKVPASWENSTRLFIKEDSGKRPSARIPKDGKPYAMIVLPVVDEKNTTIGVNDKGLPFPENLSNEVLIAGPPKLRYQYPEAGGFIDINAGKVNADGIVGSFDLGSKAIYQWYYADSNRPDAQSFPVNPDLVNGGKTQILSFGTRINPTSEKSSGWYKLVTSNAFGTAETVPVHVIIKK